MESPEVNPHVFGQLHVRLQITPKEAQIWNLANIAKGPVFLHTKSPTSQACPPSNSHS